MTKPDKIKAMYNQLHVAKRNTLSHMNFSCCHRSAAKLVKQKGPEPEDLITRTVLCMD